jgi:hypothetical protein
MRHPLVHRLAGAGFAAIIFAVAAIPAFADDFGKRFTLDVGPAFDASTTGDANSPPPAPLFGVGYTQDHPIANALVLNYGLDFKIDARTHLYANHDVFDFSIGRILTAVPGGAIVFGTFYDRTDTIGINHSFGHGLLGKIYYFDHERPDVTGLCNNQLACPNAAGRSVSNPDSIDEHGYGGGLSYNVGPETRIGNLFTLGVDAKYVPRPSVGPHGFALNGLGAYTGSGWEFPYSISMKLPIVPSHTFIPFIGYERATVLFRAESSEEMYNQTNFGIVKVFNKNLLMSLVDVNFSECRCSDTVPPPDNVRFSEILLKFDYKLQL